MAASTWRTFGPKHEHVRRFSRAVFERVDRLGKSVDYDGEDFDRACERKLTSMGLPPQFRPQAMQVESLEAALDIIAYRNELMDAGNGLKMLDNVVEAKRSGQQWILRTASDKK